jgi:FO synthase
VPELHVHAFSALEIWQGAQTLGASLDDYLARLCGLGLSSLPGTAAEILDDEVRRVICPDKVDTAQWLAVHDAAHRAGLRSNVTMMFGHVDGPRHWARHLVRAREQQRRSGGFTEFVPLPFVHMEAPMWRRGQARSGPTFGETLLVHAVARLVLHPWITNIQASWVKLGPDGVRAALRAGVNDLGGTLMNESISRAAGAEHGQELPPERMEALIRSAGRVPRQRTTLYGEPAAAQVARSFGAPPLREPWNPPAREAGLRRPLRLVRPGLDAGPAAAAARRARTARAHGPGPRPGSAG